jgi:glutamine amidotransferase
MLFETSEEGNVSGFGLLPGTVKRFQLNKNERIKIPHMGWNKVNLSNPHPMWNKIDSDSRFYFVHSFYAEVKDKSLVMATSSHGEKFTCAIAKDNLFAVQFHPEKSSELGLQLLNNFISWNI